MTVPSFSAGWFTPVVRLALGAMLASTATLTNLTAIPVAANDETQPEVTPEWQVSDTSINDGWRVTDELLNADANPALVGQWTPAEDWPLMAIHAAMAADGDILTYGTDTDGIQTGRFVYDVWRPGPDAGAGHATLANTTSTDLFCSLQLNRSDTDGMLLFGGDNWNGNRTTNTGNDDINLYDPVSDTIATVPGMNRPRWYATGTTLPDGSMYIQGGLGGSDRPEVWSPEGGAELLEFSTEQLNYNYPRNFLLTDGRVFGFDIHGRMYVVSADLTALTRLGNLPMPSFGNSTTAAMFEPDRILFFGGNTSDTWIVDMTSGTPQVSATGSMADDNRTWVNATVLPDGRVLATGGAAVSSAVRKTGPLEEFDVNTSAEVWDPSTGRWTTLAAATRARLYHSTAILLQDGRVLTAGGGAPGPVTNLDAEIFSPDYLWVGDGSAASRPIITSLSTTAVRPGQQLSLTVAATSPIDRLTLVKTGSVTHSFDMEQRFVELEFSLDGGTMTATLPTDGSLASPGVYQLWALDGDGTPSASQLLRILPTGGTSLASIEGVIRDVGGSVRSGVKVDLFRQATGGGRGPFLGHAVSDADGRYRFDVEPGCHVLTFIAPDDDGFDGQRWYQPTACVNRGQALTGVDAVLDGPAVQPTAIGGSITSADGEPVEGAKVDLFLADGPGRRGAFLGTTRTDTDGRYRFETPPDCYILTFIAPDGESYGGSPWFQPGVCLDPSQVVDDLDAVLDP